MTKNSFLASVLKFCKEDKHQKFVTKLDKKTIEVKLSEWIFRSSEDILKTVIPDQFWSDNALAKPAPIYELCPETADAAVHVVLLVLWSRCSRSCADEITKCLAVGEQQWMTELCNPRDYLAAYVFCIKTHVWYSCKELELKSKDDGVETELSRVLLQALCLHQAVANSSAMFRMLTTRCPSLVVGIFIDYLKKHKPQSTFHKGLSYLKVVFSDTDMDIVTHVSIMTWFRMRVVIPNLRKMMMLSPLKTLFRGVLLHAQQKMKIGEPMDNEFLQKSATKAATDLGIKCNDSLCNDTIQAQLLTFTMLVTDSLKAGDQQTAMTSERDESVIKQLIHAGTFFCDPKLGLKNLVEQEESPLFTAEDVTMLIGRYFDLSDNIPGLSRPPVRNEETKTKKPATGKQTKITRKKGRRSAKQASTHKKTEGQGRMLVTEDIKMKKKREFNSVAMV